MANEQTDIGCDHRSTADTPAFWIALAGAATLFVELTVIRYVPGQVRVLGYFTNFVLLAAFLGFGLGMMVHRRWPSSVWLSWSAPLTFYGIVGVTALGQVYQVLPSADEFLFLEYRSRGVQIPLYPFLTISFLILAISFMPLGHAVGRTLQGDRPLWRYGLNLVGSLLGIGVFSALSSFSPAPWVWMLIAAGFTLVGLRQAPRSWIAAGVVFGCFAAFTAYKSTTDAIWSPYQKITVGPLRVHDQKGVVQEWWLPTLTEQEREDLKELTAEEGFTIRVNDDSYQTPVDLSNHAVAKNSGLRFLRQQYDLPYKLARNVGEVLVLGAGAGNDVAGALRNGATRVDAVEIDPEIRTLGDRHPEHPYQDPRVTVHLNDARIFLAGAQKKYDMVVFGLIDSHVLLSHRSNVRLDSFVFTEEAFRLARGRLKPGGLLVLSHAVGTEWFQDRMRATLTAAFDKPPVMLTMPQAIGISYVAGDPIRAGDPVPEDTLTLRDDWPFVYLRAPAVPKDYLIVMALIAVASTIGVRLCGRRGGGGFDLHFFTLGAAFMLLETRGLGVLAVNLGSTWSVNAAVFAGVLVMALLSTVLVAKAGESRQKSLLKIAYPSLAIMLIVSFYVAVAEFTSLSSMGRILTSICLVSIPLFCGGVIFAVSLNRGGDADRAMASNLLGAMAGGLVEYFSMVTGFRNLLVLAAVFYLISRLAMNRKPGEQCGADSADSSPVSATSDGQSLANSS
jgi:SAM-dependent methyltransferase